jgi:hypothetical protein
MSEKVIQAKIRHSANFQALKHVRSEQYAIIYSNYAQCSFTPWDIRITFSEIGEVEVDQAAYIDRTTMTLPPAVAKALITVLQQNVALYEADFGEIKFPGKINIDDSNLAQELAQADAEAETKKDESAGVIDATELRPAG